jgi:hypothetical protein
VAPLVVDFQVDLVIIDRRVVNAGHSSVAGHLDETTTNVSNASSVFTGK